MGVGGLPNPNLVTCHREETETHSNDPGDKIPRTTIMEIDYFMAGVCVSHCHSMLANLLQHSVFSSSSFSLFLFVFFLSNAAVCIS